MGGTEKANAKYADEIKSRKFEYLTACREYSGK
jgi:hypothetical protein